MRLFRKSRVFLRTENDLSQTFAIAQIDKDNATMIAQNIYPTGESDLAADVALPK
jgi:hypothetical protein